MNPTVLYNKNLITQNFKAEEGVADVEHAML
jgi:hypothetical protein